MDTDWFLERIAASPFKSQRQLAFAAGMTPAALSLILSGQQRLQLHQAEAIARKLGVTLESVLQHAGVRLGKLARGKPKEPFAHVPADIRRLLISTPAKDPIWEAVRAVLRARQRR